MLPIAKEKTDSKLFLGLIITLGASMLMPEYIAPLFVFGLYIHFMKVFKSSGRNARMGDVCKLFFVYTGYMLLSSIWSDEHLMSALVSLLWMGCMLSMILLGNIINSEEKLKSAITAVNISAGIIGLMAIVSVITYNIFMYVYHHYHERIWLFPNPFYWELNDFVFDLLPIEVINYKFRSRASATFDNPLILATYLVIATPFCAFGSVSFRRSKNRKISRVCLLLALGGLVCTSSRGACVAIAVAFVIMLFSNKKVFKKIFPFCMLLAVSVPVVLLLRYRNTKVTDFIESNSQRVGIWKSCWQMFLDHPIIGMGAGTENIHQSLINDYNIPRTHAHNLFLEMIVEGGIIGGLFVAAIAVLIIINIVRICKAKDGKYRHYGFLYMAGLVGFVVMSTFEFTLQSAKELMIFFFLLGFIEATYRIATDKTQVAPDEITIVYEEVPDDEEVKITQTEEVKITQTVE